MSQMIDVILTLNATGLERLSATPGSTLIEGTVNEISNVTVNGQAAPLAFSAAAPYGFQKELNLPPGDQVITIQSTDGSNNSAQKSYTLTVRGDYALAYDVNGNLFTKTWRQAGNSGVDWVKETYAWDKENRLTGWTKERLLVNGVQTAAVLASATWTYDGLGRRVKEQNVAGAAVTDTHFVWDGLAMVQWQSAAGVAQKNLFDEGEQDVATGEKLIYVKDHLGSVRGWHRLSDGARGEADYSAWGVRTVVSNTTGTLPVRSFTGHYQHAASGLVLAPYRAYDAELGRWLSEDPIGEEGGVNLYGYVGNGVVGRVDPLGLDYCIVQDGIFPHASIYAPLKDPFSERISYVKMDFGPYLPSQLTQGIYNLGANPSGNLSSDLSRLGGYVLGVGGFGLAHLYVGSNLGLLTLGKGFVTSLTKEQFDQGVRDAKLCTSVKSTNDENFKMAFDTIEALRLYHPILWNSNHFIHRRTGKGEWWNPLPSFFQ
jgi:RHS repeat-associated protein